MKRIILHCSASDFPADDSPKAIHRLHTLPITHKIKWGNYDTTGRGWADIGYHYVITTDGEVHTGRSLSKIGAHCKGHNEGSIGIVLTGVDKFTGKQFESLLDLINHMRNKFSLHRQDVYGHYEFDPRKRCPNIDMNFIRFLL